MNADELKQEREKLGVSQREMAEALGISARTYERWERDRQAPALIDAALETAKRRIRKLRRRERRRARAAVAAAVPATAVVTPVEQAPEETEVAEEAVGETPNTPFPDSE